MSTSIYCPECSYRRQTGGTGIHYRKAEGRLVQHLVEKHQMTEERAWEVIAEEAQKRQGQDGKEAIREWDDLVAAGVIKG